MNPPNTIRTPFWAIASIAILGASIRWIIASGDLLWLDELHTSWVIRGEFTNVFSRAADGNQAPLSFVLNWILVKALGESELTIRAVSLLAGIALMFAAPWTVWKLTRSSIAAITVALLIAFESDKFVYYATEARPYGLLQFLGLIQALYFWRAIRNLGLINQTTLSQAVKWRPDGWLAVATATLVYVHFTAVWLLVAELVFLVFALVASRHKKNFQNAIVTIVGTTALIGVLCLPAMIQMTNVFARKGNWECVSSIALFWKHQGPTIALLAGLPLIGMCILKYFEVKQTAIHDPKRTARNSTDLNWAIGFALLCGLTPSICIVVLSELEIAPLALRRYVQVGAVAFPMLAGLTLGMFSSRRYQILLATIVLAANLWNAPDLMTGIWQGQIPRARFENWKSLAESVNLDQTKRQQPIFLLGNLIEDVDALSNPDPRFQSYLKFPIHSIYDFDTANRNSHVYPTGTFQKFQSRHLEDVRENGGAWIIVRANHLFAIEIRDMMKRQLLQSFPSLKNRINIAMLSSPDSNVYLFAVDLNTSTTAAAHPIAPARQ